MKKMYKSSSLHFPGVSLKTNISLHYFSNANFFTLSFGLASKTTSSPQPIHFKSAPFWQQKKTLPPRDNSKLLLCRGRFLTPPGFLGFVNGGMAGKICRAQRTQGLFNPKGPNLNTKGLRVVIPLPHLSLSPKKKGLVVVISGSFCQIFRVQMRLVGKG